MTTKHTTGPWGFIWDNGTTVIDANHGKTDIAHIINRGNPDTTDANARLIAAAPELLDQLKHALRFWDQLTQADVERYRAVIAKAEGGQP